LKPEERPKFLRQLSAKAQHVTGDKQGRIVLPDEQCKLLNLRSEVVLVGNYYRFEIWDPEKWQKTDEEDAATFSYLLERIGV
jgi:DNA-binding transcriptional regulator/RsmH inhibitor MraZ